ncbi:class III signal peptide-containing protein [Thermococcus sp. M39]|nr:class III signal peptide-containing protein [Thermococcus sp. M39]NJE08885.1 class III signal peptide-containing protein [Thermococcus sp. M39]
MKRAQTALEYLFMVAAALILVAVTLRVILDSMRQINIVIANYTTVMRQKLIENL